MDNDVVPDILFGVLIVLVPHVSLTVGLGGEAKVADLALEGLLSSV